MEKNSKRRCYARIEYRAAQQEIEARLEQGYSLSIVYDELCKAGCLTMAYTTFCDYVRGGGRRVHGKPKGGPKPPPLELALNIMAPVEARVDCGYNLRQIYQGLVNSGVEVIDYPAFYDFVHNGEKLRVNQVMGEDYLFVDKGSLLQLLEKLASFFEAESDCRSSRTHSSGLLPEAGKTAGAGFFNCRYNLHQIYRELVDSGMEIFTYAEFCDFLAADKNLRLARVFNEDFLYTRDGSLAPLFERLSTLSEAESDSANGDFYTGADSASDEIYGGADSIGEEFLGMED